MDSEKTRTNSHRFELTLEQAHSCAYGIIDALSNASDSIVATIHDHIAGWRACENDQQIQLIIKFAIQRDHNSLRSLIKSLGFTTLNRQWGYPIPPQCLWYAINERRHIIDQDAAIENRLSWVSRPFNVVDRKPRISRGGAGEYEYSNDFGAIPGHARFGYRLAQADEELLNRVWPSYDRMNPPWGFLLPQVKAALKTIDNSQWFDDATIREFDTETIFAVLDRLPSAPTDTTPAAPRLVADLSIQNLAHLVAHRFEVLYIKAHFDSLWPLHLNGAASRVTEQLRAWLPNSPESLTSLRRLAGVEAIDAGMEGDVFPLVESLIDELERQVLAAESVSQSNCDCLTAGVRPVEVLRSHLAAIDRCVWRIDAGLQRFQRERANSLLSRPQLDKSLIHGDRSQTEQLNHEVLPEGTSLVIESKAIRKATGGETLPSSIVNVQECKTKLSSIEPGREGAAEFHAFVKDVLSFIFLPDLHSPICEDKLHEGRGRIDIVFTNSAERGYFADIPSRHGIKCPVVFFECKNYRDDIAGPEFSQLTSRFSDRRSKLGFIVCRSLLNRELVQKRCRDCFIDNQHHVLVLEDADLLTMLEMKMKDETNALSQYLHAKFHPIFMDS